MIAQFVQSLLTTAGITPVYVAHLQDVPTLAVCLYDESAPVHDDSQGYAVDQWGLGVSVRGPAYAASRDLMQRIHALLSCWSGSLPGGGPLCHQTFIMSSPSHIGMDEKERHQWTAHYMMRCEGATGGSITQTRPTL